MPGEQRHLLVSPGDVTWSVTRYDDVTLPLTLSDLDRLEGKELPLSPQGQKLLHCIHKNDVCFSSVHLFLLATKSIL
jgi:hypothetical protein